MSSAKQRWLARLTLCAAAAAAACGRAGEDEPGRIENQAQDVAYVGAATCAGCHTDKEATFEHTGMGRSFYRLTPEVAVEDFTVHNTIDVPKQGLRYRMTQRDGRFYMRQSVPDAHGAEIASDERELIYVIGSGNHSRSYVTVLDGKLFQAPVCWYPEGSLWDVCPGFEDKNDQFSREITETCVFCHNARMVLERGERNRYVEPIPEGIDCERCHGPGALHVRRWRTPGEEPDERGDPTIVNPRRLPPELRIQICFQCHLGDSKATERVPRHGRALAAYRPGRPVTDVMVPFYFRAPSDTDFGISAQADRFLRSRCYVESGGKIECLTCHDPHVSVYRKDRPASFFRDTCLSCHAPADCSDVGHGDDCVACHMRKVEPDDHRHTRFTDHWIRKPEPRPAAPSTELIPVLPAAFDALPEAERAYYRGRACFLKAMDLPEPARAALWREGEAALRAAIAGGFDTADAWFFLGKTLRYERRADDARAAFRAALAKDPGHRDATLALATALASAGRAAESMGLLETLLARAPSEPGALAELARARAASGAPHIEVLALYDRAVQAEPWNAAFRLNRAVILEALERKAEAADACRDAERLGTTDARIFASCAEIFRTGGFASDAEQAERRAAFLAAGSP